MWLKDIWEGAVEVYPIIKHFKDKIISAGTYRYTRNWIY